MNTEVKRNGVEVGSKTKIFASLVVMLFIFSAFSTAQAQGMTGNNGAPIPPFDVYGFVYDGNGNLISNVDITIENLRTGESIKAEVYETCAYECILEELPSGYEVGDTIQITAVSDGSTIYETFVIEHIGFGKKLDLYFNSQDSKIASADSLLSTEGSPDTLSEFSMPIDEFAEDAPPPEEEFDELGIEQDLSVRGVSFSNIRPEAGEIITVTAVITAAQGAPDVNVSFYLNFVDEDNKIGTRMSSFHGLSQPMTASLNWNTTGFEGEYMIFAVVDPDETFYEADETNNIAHSEIVVVTVPFMIESVKEQVINLRDLVDEKVGEPHSRGINSLLDVIERKLNLADNFYDNGKTAQAVNTLNHAVDSAFLVVDKISLLEKQGTINEADADMLILEVWSMINNLIETTDVMVDNPMSEDIANAEKSIAEIRVTGTIQLGRDNWWGIIDNKFSLALNKYQTAMKNLAEDKDIQAFLEAGEELLLETKDEIGDYVIKGRLPEIFGTWAIVKIDETRLIFPPDLTAIPQYIEIEGDLIKGEPSWIKIPVSNAGIVSAKDVQVDIYDELENGDKTLLSSSTISKIESGSEDFVTFEWTPETRGPHYLNIHIDPENKIGEANEGDNVIREGVWVIGGTIWWNSTHYVDTEERYNNVEIRLQDRYGLGGDLIINSTGRLIFEDNVTLRIDRIDPLESPLKIKLNHGGSFDILDRSIIVAKQESLSYKFFTNSWLNVTDNSSVRWMWGDISDLSKPGGIQALEGSKVNIAGSKIMEGTTHNIYVKDSSPTIMNSNVTKADLGHGIFVEGMSSPIIENCLIEDNVGEGIYLDSSIGRIVNNTIQYNQGNGTSVHNMISPYGEPTYIPGTDVGYFIWHDNAGWHLRMSGDGGTDYFNGTITASESFTNLNYFDFETGEGDTAGIGNPTSFNMNEGSGEDSLDFNITGGTVTFDLWLNDAYQTFTIFVGSSKANPVSVPFLLSEYTKIANNNISFNTGFGVSSILSNVPIIGNTITFNGQAGIVVSGGSPYISDNFVSATTYSGKGLPGSGGSIFSSPALLQLLNRRPQSQTQISLDSISFDTIEGEPLISSDLKIEAYPPGVDGLYLVQFSEPLTNEMIEQIEGLGATVYDSVPSNAFGVMMDETTKTSVENLPFIQWCGLYQPAYKISSKINRNLQNSTNVTVMIMNTDAVSDIVAEVTSLSNVVLKEWQFRDYYNMRIQINSDIVSKVAHIPEVYWIEPYMVPEIFDEVSDEIVGGSFPGYGSYVNSLGYNGTGVNISIVDTGLDTGVNGTMHEDLRGRVLGYIDYTEDDDTDGVAEDINGHGTHCTGIVAGNASIGTTDTNSYLYGLGVAPNAKILAQRIFGDSDSWEGPSNQELVKDAFIRGAVLGSNSWGSRSYGAYTLDDAEFDALVRDADNDTAGDQEYTMIFAAGNEGSAGAGSTGSPGNAKNVITVGASENYRLEGSSAADNPDEIAYFSSRGLTDDGRIKPDIVAPGTWIASLQTHDGSPSLVAAGYQNIDDDYQWCSGTSQACPHVAGGAALFIEYYRNLYGVDPSPAMIKAVLINSADDIGTPDIPNGNEGWGRMNLTNALEPVGTITHDDHQLLENGQWQEYKVTVTDTTQPLKITMAWTDPPGSPNAAKTLVNNLDLDVIAPDGTVYYGNQFSNGWSDSSLIQNDDINNIECVYINPSELLVGTYIVRVIAVSLLEDSISATSAIDQDYAIVLNYHGTPTSKGIVEFDKTAYQSNSTAGINLVDADLTAIPNIMINLASSPTGDLLQSTLTETVSGSSYFTGSATLEYGDSNPPDNILQVKSGDTITVEYEDADDGTGSPATAIDTAIIDDTMPIISNIAVTRLSYGTVAITWDTDESSDSTVIWGDNVPPLTTASNPRKTTAHIVFLTNLLHGVTYYFAVQSKDVADNIAIDDNSGEYFKFVVMFDFDVGSGIVVIGDSSPHITKNNLTDNYHGIVVGKDSSSNIEANNINYNWNDGIQINEAATSLIIANNNNISSNPRGIYVNNSAPTIENNDIGWNTIGISVAILASPSIIGNTIISNTNYGVYSNSASPVLRDGNNISLNNVRGIYLEGGGLSTVDNNTISLNYQGIFVIRSMAIITRNHINSNDGIGILTGWWSQSTITDNTIQLNLVGIKSTSSDTSLISGNNITSNDNCGIYIQSSGATIAGNNITSNGYGYTSGAGIRDQGSHAIVEDNNILLNRYGCYMVWSSSTEVIRNNISSSNTYGIYLFASWPSISYNNIFSSNTYGIYMYGGKRPTTISHNNISGSSSNLIYCYDSLANIKNNTFIQSGTGHVVYAYGSTSTTYTCYPVIQENNITGTGTQRGIGIYGTAKTTIENNTISLFSYGIYINSNEEPMNITGNNIRLNNYGIFCDSSHPSIMNNNISQNIAYGIYSRSSGPYIANNIISINGYGVYFENSSYSPELSINCLSDGSRKRDFGFFNPESYLNPLPTLTVPNRAIILDESTFVISGESLGTSVEVVSNPAGMGQHYAHVWEDRVYWLDKREGVYSLFTYNISTMEEEYLVDVGSNIMAIQGALWDDQYVWIYENHLYSYNISADIVTELSNKVSRGYSTSIHNDKVVWRDSRDGNYEIYMYNLTSNEETRITNNLEIDDAPCIFGNKIVWHKYLGWEYAIYLYDLGLNGVFEDGGGDDSEKWITPLGSGTINTSPSIHNNFIAWQSDKDGVTSDNWWNIYVFNLSNNETVKITNAHNNVQPEIWGDKVVYQIINAVPGPFGVAIYDISDGNTTILSLTAGISPNPSQSIHGNIVAWQEMCEEEQTTHIHFVDMRIFGDDIFSSNVKLDIGDDGVEDWVYSGEFNEIVFINETDNGLVSLLNSRVSGTGLGDVTIPLNVSVDEQGKIVLENINIKYVLRTELRNNIISDTVNDAIYCYDSSFLIVNSTITNSTGYDFSIGGDSHPVSLNTTFNKTNTIYWDASSNLTVQWFLHVKVLYESLEPTSNATVWVNDTSHNLVELRTTNINGRTNWVICTEYVENSITRTLSTPHYATATYENLIGYATPNAYMNQSKEVIIILSEPFLLPLHEGWNLISLPNIQFDPYIRSAFYTIEGEWDRARWFDTRLDYWKSYNIYKPEYQNNLLYINHTMGIWIHATANTTLAVMGSKPIITEIPLYYGYNLVGYPSYNDRLASDALSGLPVGSIAVYDSTAPMLIRDVYDLTTVTMTAGEGYWVKVTDNCTWTVISDTIPPQHSNEYPPPDGASTNTTPVISIHITDMFGVEVSTIRLYVSAFSVFYDLDPITDGYNVSYYHEAGFAPGTTVVCQIVAEDIYGNVLDYTWEFTVPP